MDIEFVCDIEGKNVSTLRSVGEELPDADVDYHSGLGGLEIIGTIAIPGTALLLQLFSIIRDARRKDSTINIVQIHIHQGDQHLTINTRDRSDLEAAVEDGLARLK